MTTAARTTVNGASAYSNYNLPAGYAAEITVKYHPLGKNKKPLVQQLTAVYYVTANSLPALKLIADSEVQRQQDIAGTILAAADKNYFKVTKPSTSRRNY